ncbi:MAG TPA: indole-3-glycerol-phosphate synthase TrpC, partial [Gammaproteobacteria bacterium]|nr:indole-3-glycerol-phosphate synthase TrpC [Gammaproteobacteria bacterium]
MSSNAPDILKKILLRKREEIAERSQIISLEKMQSMARAAMPVRGFIKAIEAKIKQGKPGIIAEIKKASPSKGVIRENFEPVAIAR